MTYDRVGRRGRLPCLVVDCTGTVLAQANARREINSGTESPVLRGSRWSWTHAAKSARASSFLPSSSQQQTATVGGDRADLELINHFPVSRGAERKP